MLTLTILAVVALTSAAAADCTCRAKDVVASQGEVVCLATPQGERMARCDKVLNNASWTFLERPCPAPAVVGLSPTHRPALASRLQASR